MRHSSNSFRRSAAALVGWATLLALNLGACAGQPGPAAAPLGLSPEASPGAAVTTGSPLPLGLSGGDAGPKPDACPRLESLLYDTAQAPDPQAQARQLGMILDDAGRVLVLITLAGSDPADLSAYGATVSGQADAIAQAFAPFDQLCALSNDPRVLMVRLASRPETS